MKILDFSVLQGAINSIMLFNEVVMVVSMRMDLIMSYAFWEGLGDVALLDVVDH